MIENKRETVSINEPKKQLIAVAGMVTLYNSEEAVVQRIGTYNNQVEKLYVVDNSEVPDKALIQQITTTYANINYISNNGNKGIANALNVAAETAGKEGFHYLLMMDDDSEADKNMVNALVTYIDGYPESDLIGIIAAQSDPNLIGNRVREVWFTITSGSMINISAYRKCGPFQDELFIDAVDHEYCYRVIKAGYKVINLDYLPLNHRIGEVKRLTVFNKTLYTWASHSPARNYYMLRNFLYVLKKYWGILPLKTKVLVIYALTKVCLVNSLLENDTSLRFRYIRQAVSDFRNNKMGKLTQTPDLN